MNNRRHRSSILVIFSLCALLPAATTRSLAASSQPSAQGGTNHGSSAGKAADVPQDPVALRKLIVKIVENGGDTKYTFNAMSSDGVKSYHYLDSARDAHLDLDKCTFDRNSVTQVDGGKPTPTRLWVRLWEVQSVETGDANELRQRFESPPATHSPASGDPQGSTGEKPGRLAFAPGFPAVAFVLDDGIYRQFPVATDEDGERLAKSLRRAVALCGGPGAPRASADRGDDARRDLETTRRFIVDTMNDEGKINYSMRIENANDKSTWSNQWSYQVSDANVDFVKCAWTWKQVMNQGTQDNPPQPIQVSLSAIEDVTVSSVDDAQKEIDANGGHPEYNDRATPAVSALIVRQPHGAFTFLLFHSDAKAGHVRNAVQHAAELCGGLGGGAAF